MKHIPDADAVDEADSGRVDAAGWCCWWWWVCAEDTCGTRLGVGLRLALLRLWTSTVACFVTFKDERGSVAGVAGVAGVPGRPSCATGCAKDSSSILLKSLIMATHSAHSAPTRRQRPVVPTYCFQSTRRDPLIHPSANPSLPPSFPPSIHSFIHSSNISLINFIHPVLFSF